MGLGRAMGNKEDGCAESHSPLSKAAGIAWAHIHQLLPELGGGALGKSCD